MTIIVPTWGFWLLLGLGTVFTVILAGDFVVRLKILKAANDD